MPYPKLHVYAQSLLDTGNRLDLQNLVDGMSLTESWGEKNLNLEGTPDRDWLMWRASLLGNANYPEWCDKPELGPKKRDIWYRMASSDAKRRRQGWKFKEHYETIFRKRGSRDPRVLDRDDC